MTRIMELRAMSSNLMYRLESITSSSFWSAPIILIAVIILSKLWEKIRVALNTTSVDKLSHLKLVGPQYSEDDYIINIEPIPNFDLANTPPLKLRPFKPKYHMTMAVEKTSVSDLIAMDNTFASRCAIRTHLLETQRHEVLACNPRAVPAVLELYHWLVRGYLPQRFPTVYTRIWPDIRNNVTGSLLPMQLPETMEAAEQALELMGQNVDDEFLLMLPSLDPKDDSKYRLEAFINCFPSGFNTRSKLNRLLNEIHSPVPGYSARLEKSMDRYFANLPVGKVVKRANWGINTNGELFCLAGNHMSEEELAAREKGEEKVEKIDIEKTVLRCERQTLHRLPQSRALVFAFKTYQYPIRELRDEGSGELLAEAIDGLGKGNVPGITVYKKQVVWGETAKAFLRGETDG